jgi:hypothetical protein
MENHKIFEEHYEQLHFLQSINKLLMILPSVQIFEVNKFGSSVDKENARYRHGHWYQVSIKRKSIDNL